MILLRKTCEQKFQEPLNSQKWEMALMYSKFREGFQKFTFGQCLIFRCMECDIVAVWVKIS